MPQKAKKRIGVLGVVAAALIIAAVVFTVITRAGQKELITVHGDGTLKAGKYYIDGGKDNYYYEVFEDKTIRLCGGDIEEFVIMRGGRNLNPEDENYAEYRESVKQTAEWLASRKSYIVADVNYPEKSYTRVFFERTAEDVMKNEGGAFLNCIDENSFEQYYTFIRAE